jgi:hypothetical protein
MTIGEFLILLGALLTGYSIESLVKGSVSYLELVLSSVSLFLFLSFGVAYKYVAEKFKKDEL